MPIALATLALAASKDAENLDVRFRPTLEAASRAIGERRPAQALDLLAPVITTYQRQNATDKRQIYCGMSGPETLLYMTMSATGKKDAVAIGPGYCDALYLQGFALVDLGRVGDARKSYEQAVALAPMHAHFLVELGQTFRVTKDWPRMLDTCGQAASAAEMAPDDIKNREKGFAWRCQGFALIEQGKWDEAEKLYRDCLKLDPNDLKAQNELKFIAEQRAKPTA